MSPLFLAVVVVVAFVAAVRSTWSPCGLSMLSSITPVAEAGRGNRYGTTAAWFVLGATAGGATLGLLAAVLAALVALGTPGQAAALTAGAALLLVGAWCDAGVLGRQPPFLHRQVDETWLRGFRGWVYGAGFGWQIGVGLTTYIMTAAVFATVALAALTAQPAQAFAIGVFFGTTRGLVVLLSARATTPARVAALHRRLDRAEAPVRHLVIAVQAVAAAALAWLGLGPVVAVVVLLLAGLPIELANQRATRQATS